jgi:hypothetical protein
MRGFEVLPLLTSLPDGTAETDTGAVGSGFTVATELINVTFFIDTSMHMATVEKNAWENAFSYDCVSFTL